MCSALRYMDRISTRVSGHLSTMRRVASTPSSSGIAMSMMTISGRSRRAWATASRPLPATATTCKSLPPSSRARRPSLTTAWSSASITETGMVTSPSSIVFHQHLHATVGAGLQTELRPDRLGPLAHDEEPPARLRAGTVDALRIEADAVVAHREDRAPVLAPDRDLHALCVGVLGDIVERFLGDAEHGKIDRLGQVRSPSLFFEGDRNSRPARKAGGERAQRGRKAVIVQRVGPQLRHDVAHGVDRAFDERTAILQARGQLGFRPSGQAAGDDTQIDSERGEILPDPVVQLGSEQSAFGLLHLDQAPGGGLKAVGVTVEIFLHALAVGNVVDDLREAAQLSGLVAQRRQNDVRPELRAVLAHPPALALVAPLERGKLELHSRVATGRVIGEKEARIVLADDLVGEIALDALRPEVPAGDVALHVEHVDGVVAHVLYHHAEALLRDPHLLLGELPFGDVLAHTDDAHRLARLVPVDARLIVEGTD